MVKISFRDRIIEIARKHLSPETRNWFVQQQKNLKLQWPPVGTVRFGSFRRLTPISPVFALDRGFPIERYYIEKFLQKHSLDIRGNALEFGDDFYIRKFGGDQVKKIDVLSSVESPQATIVTDLTQSDNIPSNQFDCIIATQTLQMIYDIKSAVKNLHRILKTGGVLLVTSHGISKIGRRLGRDKWGEYWHITTQSATKLFEENFPQADIEVDSYGNVLTAMCELHGLASSELSTKEIDYLDPDFEVIITIRAVKY